MIYHCCIIFAVCWWIYIMFEWCIDMPKSLVHVAIVVCWGFHGYLFYQAHTLSLDFQIPFYDFCHIHLNSELQEIWKYNCQFIFFLSCNNTNISCILASVELSNTETCTSGMICILTKFLFFQPSKPIRLSLFLFAFYLPLLFLSTVGSVTRIYTFLITLLYILGFLSLPIVLVVVVVVV